MPLPGDDFFGKRKGSYSPGDDNLDTTPYKPVPLTFQQGDGTMPLGPIPIGPAPIGPTNATTPYSGKQTPLAFQQDDMPSPNGVDRNSNKRQPQHHRQDSRQKKKRCCIIIAVIIAIILLLALILALSICLGTDLCTASSSSYEEKADHAHRAQLRGDLAAPVIPEPGRTSFLDHLNATVQGRDTSAPTPDDSASGNVPTKAITSHHRRRRSGNGDQELSSHVSAIDDYLAAKITMPLLSALKSSDLCRDIDCFEVMMDNMRLNEHDIIECQFNLSLGYDSPITVGQESIENTMKTIIRDFADAFNKEFPGYQLHSIEMSFDTAAFCEIATVYCQNISGINDTVPIVPSTASIPEDTTVPDRSELLPPIFPIFNKTDESEGSTSETTTSANTADSTETSTMGDLTSAVSTVSRSISSTPTSTSTALTRAIAPATLTGTGMADCSRFGFLCANKTQSVSQLAKCDGIVQCNDGSDEQGCKQCRTSFSCPNGDDNWMCRRGKIICDGRVDCPTEHDESAIHCKPTCRASEYKCEGTLNPSICIPKRWLCDGDAQCPQGDDEADCKSKSKCNNQAFFCAADQHCVPSWAQCDGVHDCTDGADEENCSCVECSGNSTALCTAPLGRCIQRRQVCDGKKDCPNGEDEQNCRT